ncbi:hypothetical protein MYCTH_2312733 [Thermothelomyces thermophilus ATCC 42464]|uniref:Stc1 domain-containing protein n=1 Tax=Thermothelomyces thermophilus (strain ATCC 42464 / BCRC 31852 / DSM 1799) TaxID=573729 RepID=G2QN63_THET4|nr:uncharacterized protein MYCTH_2312733 [Thermothelomyces thermophilus ATCC 42464]AEO61936.1 hypothetical protein MYCTH_2312733 [Thermothelomyces thermophilus ATCC 42464]
MTGQLRCEQGEWKPRASFSKNQLSKYDRNAQKGSSTPSKTGIRCMEHSSKPVLEEKCRGPCGRWREKRLFSKSTVRKGVYWCVDCVDWQIRTENGEALPPPGGQLSAEETNPVPTRASRWIDDEFSTSDYATFSDEEPSSAFDADFNAGIDDDGSDMMSARPSSEQRSSAAHDTSETATVSGSDRLGALIPPRLRHSPSKAPHWLIPDDMNEVPTGSVRYSTVTGDSASVGNSSMSTLVREGQGQTIPYNAWGPNGEYARMVKVPTVASDTTRRTRSIYRPSQVTKQSKSDWAKVVSDALQSGAYLS